MPRLLVGMAAHTGQHYWTNADTRSTANSICSVSPQHVVCYHDSFVHLTAGVVTQVAKLCLCTSGHELLVGKESISSSYSPPFHPTYKHHQTQVQKMDLSNLLNQ